LVAIGRIQTTNKLLYREIAHSKIRASLGQPEQGLLGEVGLDLAPEKEVRAPGVQRLPETGGNYPDTGG
jgi:hypothetical protein